MAHYNEFYKILYALSVGEEDAQKFLDKDDALRIAKEAKGKIDFPTSSYAFYRMQEPNQISYQLIDKELEKRQKEENELYPTKDICLFQFTNSTYIPRVLSVRRVKEDSLFEMTINNRYLSLTISKKDQIGSLFYQYLWRATGKKETIYERKVSSDTDMEVETFSSLLPYQDNKITFFYKSQEEKGKVYSYVEAQKFSVELWQKEENEMFHKEFKELLSDYPYLLSYMEHNFQHMMQLVHFVTNEKRIQK